ncbi:MAG: alpha/beta hydrolase, partial [Marmoricola sp.]
APTDPPVPQPSPLHWGACPSGQTLTGLQCATLKVPLDYRKPTGTKITLQLSRAVHTSSARQYLGAMLTDPGGPGGSGLAMPYISTRVPHGVGSRFDWIGWDPRGVGQSRPALHCIPRYFGTDRPPYAAAGTRSYWLRQAKRYAAACGRNGGALLQHMTTEDNARDMDVIRQALRQSAISYYGFSWGTYLGQVYATLFPQRIKRLVLDGVVDPRRDWYAANLDQDVSFERAIKIFFGWVAAHHDVYRLGTTAAAVYATFRHELATLTARPGAGGRLGPDELTDVMLDAGYFTPDWAQDASMLSRLVNDGDASGVLNAYLLRNSGPGNENQYAVYAAVQCTDFAWPAWPKTLADNVRLARTAPFETWGNAWYNAPCLTWPVPPHQPVAVRAAAGLPSILLIAETYDAATPFPGALAARAVFPSSSLIEGVGGTMHAGSLNGVGCTDEAIAQYLATGRTPARRPGRGADLRCPHVPRPPASLS